MKTQNGQFLAINQTQLVSQSICPAGLNPSQPVSYPVSVSLPFNIYISSFSSCAVSRHHGHHPSYSRTNPRVLQEVLNFTADLSKNLLQLSLV